MKSILKLSLSLLGNQILASIAGFMSVLFVWFLAGDSTLSQIIFLCITMPFFIYIEYRAAFNYGFHNPDRRNNPENRSYLYKGAVAGVISAIPLYLLIILFLIFEFSGNVYWAETFKLYTRMFSMYYNWPMCNIFPNHDVGVILTSVFPVVIFPTLGYIAGYKNILVTEPLFKFFRKNTGV